MYKPIKFGHLEGGGNPMLRGRKLTIIMVINHLLTGMILQVLVINWVMGPL